MTELTITIPGKIDRRLSPNARVHWRTLAAAKGNAKDTAFAYARRDAFTVGQDDLSAATYPSGSYWKLSGARVSLLTAGDSYNYSSKSISSSKSLIGTRYYSGYYDSPDIFSAFETSRVLTRVVDQSASYNLGAAPAPDYSTAPFYPANAPTITLRFTRDGSSKGYYSAGRYTVVKARLDIY